MPVKIPDDLPAASILESENVFVMREGRANTQDIRPLEILLLTLLQMASHESKNTTAE